MNQKGIRVFVYGTLKGMSRGTLVGKARTVRPYLLFDGNFPVLKDLGGPNDNRKGYVLGEVYDVDLQELSELDQYEGYPSLYTRKVIPINAMIHENARDISLLTRAWTYFGEDVSLRERRIILPDESGNVFWT